METLAEYAWIGIVIILIWICYRIWKRGRYRDPGQENTYFDSAKKQTQFPQYQCPYDMEGRGCKHYNEDTGYKAKNCAECDWYNKGNFRPGGILGPVKDLENDKNKT